MRKVAEGRFWAVQVAVPSILFTKRSNVFIKTQVLHWEKDEQENLRIGLMKIT